MVLIFFASKTIRIQDTLYNPKIEIPRKNKKDTERRKCCIACCVAWVSRVRSILFQFQVDGIATLSSRKAAACRPEPEKASRWRTGIATIHIKTHSLRSVTLSSTIPVIDKERETRGWRSTTDRFTIRRCDGERIGKKGIKKGRAKQEIVKNKTNERRVLARTIIVSRDVGMKNKGSELRSPFFLLSIDDEQGCCGGGER